MVGDRSSPLEVRASARRPPSAPLTSREPSGRNGPAATAPAHLHAALPLAASRDEAGARTGPLPIGPQEDPARPEWGGPSAERCPPGGPEQVEGVPARCVRSQEEGGRSERSGWLSRRTVEHPLWLNRHLNK